MGGSHHCKSLWRSKGSPAAGSTCGGFRRAGARTCIRCSQPTLARPPPPPAIGDCILGPLGVKPPGAASVLAPPVQESPPPRRVDIPPLHLPNDFQERVLALPSNTMLHVPPPLPPPDLQTTHDRNCCAAGGGSPQAWMSMPWRRKAAPKCCWPWCQGGLERGTRSLNASSSGSSRSSRLSFSAAKLLNQKHKKRKRRPQQEGRGDRARRTAAAGAYGKATSRLVSSMMEKSDSEDRQWASKLIPNSDFSSGIYVLPKHESEVCDARNGFDRPFAGLRYAALTAHGSAGSLTHASAGSAKRTAPPPLQLPGLFS